MSPPKDGLRHKLGIGLMKDVAGDGCFVKQRNGRITKMMGWVGQKGRQSNGSTNKVLDPTKKQRNTYSG